MSNFIEDCINGNAKLSEANDYIDQWHESKTDLPIYEFLGMTTTEYELFVKDEKYLETIFTAHKENKDIEHVLQDEAKNYTKSKKN